MDKVTFGKKIFERAAELQHEIVSVQILSAGDSAVVMAKPARGNNAAHAFVTWRAWPNQDGSAVVFENGDYVQTAGEANESYNERIKGRIQASEIISTSLPEFYPGDGREDERF